MKEPVDDPDPVDLSKDNKLKQVLRDAAWFLWDIKKPIPTDERPWWHPMKLTPISPWLSDDPIETPRQKTLAKEYYVLGKQHTEPFFDSIFTDLLSQPMQQQSSPCAHLELKSLECIEYYGAQRGVVICKDFYDDWSECTSKTLQTLRARAMQFMYKKKYHEYLRGERQEYPYKTIPHPHAYEEPFRSLRNDWSDGYGH